ncbi:MAG: DbpA RNA binding domain-containing protein [Bacteroidales bacterium]|nr:DbpA RNA binding domain-containing protein [Bacteroidales bacterium]
MSREELIQRFVSVEFNRFLDYYRDAEDLNPGERHRQENQEFAPRERTRRKSEGYGSEQGFSRFFISMGRTQRLTPQWVIGMINDFTGRRDIPIGRIDIGQKFSFFEVGSAFEKDILKGFSKAEGVRVKLAIPEDSPDTGKPYKKKGKKKDW